MTFEKKTIPINPPCYLVDNIGPTIMEVQFLGQFGHGQKMPTQLFWQPTFIYFANKWQKSRSNDAWKSHALQ